MAKCLNCLYINKVSKTPVNYWSSIVKSLKIRKILVCHGHLVYSIQYVEMITVPWILQRGVPLISE